jgi:hypothetical protein
MIHQIMVTPHGIAQFQFICRHDTAAFTFRIIPSAAGFGKPPGGIKTGLLQSATALDEFTAPALGHFP